MYLTQRKLKAELKNWIHHGKALELFVLAKLYSYMYKVKLQKMIITINHDRLKLCKDRDIPSWLSRCQHRLREGENIILSVDRNLHCLCRKPDDGQFMIQCDYCDEWSLYKPDTRTS